MTAKDLGVSYARTRQAIIRVQADPAQGQYAYNDLTGDYEFAAADANFSVIVSVLDRGVVSSRRRRCRIMRARK